jgi:predicted nucleic acid-binding protein
MRAPKSSNILVLDASVAAKWFINEPDAAQAQTLLEEVAQGRWQLVAPDLFQIELAHIFWKHREQGYVRGQLRAALRELKTLRMELVPAPSLFDKAVDIAYNHEIAVYDACYMALATAFRAPLASFDQALIKKSKAAKIILYPLHG